MQNYIINEINDIMNNIMNDITNDITVMTKGHSDYMSKADCSTALLRMTLCKVFQCFIDPLFLPSIVLFSHVFHCYMFSPIVLILTLLSCSIVFSFHSFRFFFITLAA